MSNTDHVKALVLSVHSTVYDAIRSSTKAIAFFGTPHRGGNGADLGSTIASIMRAFTGSAKNDFMDTLQKSSSGATNIHEMFKEQVSNYQIVSFYETLPYMTGSSFVSFTFVYVRNLSLLTPQDDC